MVDLPRRSLLAALAAAPFAAALSGAPAFAQAPEVVEMTIGSDDAPVTMVEYAMFTCPHCAAFNQEVLPQIKANYIDTGKVKLVFREVYFNKPSLWAAMIARCAPADRYFGIADLLFQRQADWAASTDENTLVQKLFAIGRQAGMTDETMNACLQDRAMAEALVAEFQKNAAADGVDATPMFIDQRRQGRQRPLRRDRPPPRRGARRLRRVPGPVSPGPVPTRSHRLATVAAWSRDRRSFGAGARAPAGRAGRMAPTERESAGLRRTARENAPPERDGARKAWRGAALERKRRGEAGHRAAVRVADGDGEGVELQAVGRRRVAVERVAEDRVAEGGEVDAELVAAAGQRAELDPRRAPLAGEHAPVGQRRLAAVVADHLPRPVRPVADQRQVDAAFLVRDGAGDAGDVGLRHLAALELPAEVALREAGACHQHDARGVAVEAVDEERVGPGGAGAGLEAVLGARRLGRDGVEARGLVPDEEMGVGVEQALAHRMRRDGRCGPALAAPRVRLTG